MTALARPPAAVRELVRGPGRRRRPVEVMPLSALRPRLDEASAGVRWLADPDGVIGRVLLMPAPTTLTFPISLEGHGTFSADALLLPHDWRDRRGAVRLHVSSTDAAGRERRLWSGTLRTADAASPLRLTVRCPLPADIRRLVLEVESLAAEPPYPLDRAAWVNPAIADPAGAVPDAPPATPAPVGVAPHPARERAVATAARPAAGPTISVLVPVHDPPPAILAQTVDSVRRQTYEAWELCLVDDGCTDPSVIAALHEHAAADPRVRLVRRETAGGIAVATNTALAMATGSHIALLDHDDTLDPDALAAVAARLAAEPALDMIYTDEDIVLDGRRVWAHHKPDWSPDTLRTNGYTCHLGVYRRELVTAVGGFRTEFNGSQDVDMILRLVERTDRIAHIPRILYHWRVHPGSTAGDAQAKPYAYVAARNAIAAHLGRVGIDAQVEFGPPGLYRVAHRPDPSVSVDLVLAVDGTEALAEAAASWVAQPHSAWSVVVAAPPAVHAAVTEVLTAAGVAPDRIRMIPAESPAAGAGLAAAAEAATAEHLALMQSPCLGLTHDWLTRLLGYSRQPGIAAAGPVIVAGDGRIQQAGVALPQGVPLHLLHGHRSSMDELFGYGTSVYNVSAVSGLLVTPRARYHRLGGLDPASGELGLIEYCGRATQDGHRIVVVPDARLRTVGPDPTSNDLAALRRLRARWTETHAGDPYYNPNYRADRGDFVPVRR